MKDRLKTHQLALVLVLSGVVAALVLATAVWAYDSAQKDKIAPGVTILPIRIANNASDVTAGSIAAGIRAATDGGAAIINVSSSTTARDDGLSAAVDYAFNHGVMIVASAANSAKNGDPITYPASYPSVIAVGAVDANGQRADFSQTGPYLDLVAPGVDVVSVGPGGPGHWQGSGTSYAAPFVAATAALIRAYRPNLSITQVRHRLEVTADAPPARLPDAHYGWGLVNPMAAVASVLPEETVHDDAVHKGASLSSPYLPTHSTLGENVVTLGLVGGLCAIFAMCVLHRLVPAGRRRRWRPGRRARPEGPAPARPHRSGIPGIPAIRKFRQPRAEDSIPADSTATAPSTAAP